MKDISRKHLTLTEEMLYARRWRLLGDTRALDRLVETHMGLVIRCAMDHRNAGPPMDDLVQEGSIGLTIAARRFDPDAGCRLATYAMYWIRACILEAIIRSHGPMRFGTTRSQRKIYFKFGKARRAIEAKGEVATAEKLAAVIGVPVRDMESALPRILNRDISLDAAALVLAGIARRHYPDIANHWKKLAHRRESITAVLRTINNLSLSMAPFSGALIRPQ